MGANKEYDKWIAPMKISCQITASWPVPSTADRKTVFRNDFRRRISMLVILIALAFMICQSIITFGDDIDETIECCVLGLAFCVSFIRVLVFDRYQSAMRYVVETMERDWIDSTGEQRELLWKGTIASFKVTKLYTTLVILCAVAFLGGPLLEYLLGGPQMVPYPTYYFNFNYTATTTRYACTYVVNLILNVTAISTISGAATFNVVATMHAAAKFTLVQKDFKRLKTSDWLTNEQIGKCVQKHLECIRFAEELETVMNIITLAQFVISTALMCLSGFQLTMIKINDTARLMKYVQFLNAAILELFMYSYSGQSLITESEIVAESAYSSDWYGIVPSTNIELVTMRARKPCSITAGKFYDLSLESFLKVMSTSFSYFTVLLTVKDD